MAKKRYINTEYWSDTFIVEKLEPLDRYLFLYFLTNTHTRICGIYEVSMRGIVFETGLEEKTIKKILEKLDEKVYFKDGWVYVKNFIKHQVINESVLKGIKREIAELPQKVVEWIQSVNRVGADCDILNLTLLNLTIPNSILPTTDIQKNIYTHWNSKKIIIHFWTHKWTLEDFLVRGLTRFLEAPISNWLKNKQEENKLTTGNPKWKNL